MANLPFVVQPKFKPVKVQIGNDEIGIFEIERKGYLTVAEKSFVDNFMSGSGGMREIVNLSNKISIKKKVKKEAAYNIIMNVMGGNIDSRTEKEVADEFSEEIAEISTLMIETQNKRSIAVATILLQSRIDPNWTLEDTFKIDPEMIKELNNFYEQEDAKLRPETEEKEEEELAKEIVGK